MATWTQPARVRLIAAVAALLMGLMPLAAQGAHADTYGGDPSLGMWDHTCRVIWAGSDATITFASDGWWATEACDAVVSAPSTQYAANDYEYYPLTAPRPGLPVCVFVLSYAGYWLEAQQPYDDPYTGDYRYNGAAQIAVRDTPNEFVGGDACASIENQLDGYNEAHGFNDVREPLATVYECTACGGGGGGPSTGDLGGALPGGPKPTKVVKKPAHCLASGPNPQHLPKCKA